MTHAVLSDQEWKNRPFSFPVWVPVPEDRTRQPKFNLRLSFRLTVAAERVYYDHSKRHQRER